MPAVRQDTSTQLEKSNLIMHCWKYEKHKKDITSSFSLIILTGISAACEAFLRFNLLTPFNVSFRETNLKLNFGLSMLVILFLIDLMLGWSLYFSNASITGSVKRLTDGSLIEGLSDSDKFLVMLQKYLLNVSATLSGLKCKINKRIDFN